MEAFDPYAYFHPIHSVPDDFSDVACINQDLKQDPDSVYARIAHCHYMVRIGCETILRPYTGISLEEREIAEDSHILLRRSEVMKKSLPLDITLPVNVDYENRRHVDSKALVTAVWLEVIRALKQEVPETLVFVQLAKARSLYSLFHRLWGLQIALNPQTGRGASYAIAARFPSSDETGKNQLLIML